MSTNTTTIVRPAPAAGSVDGAPSREPVTWREIPFLGVPLAWLVDHIVILARGVWHIVSPVLGVVSPLGWIVVGLGLAFLAVSLIWSWRELTFLGATLIAAVVLATAFVAGRSTYSATVELEPSRVVVGERAFGRLEVTNVGKRPLLSSRIEMPVGTGMAEFGIPGLKPREQTDELFAVPTERRAVIVAGPVVAVRGDQLGLLRRTVRCADAVELFVHPRTARLAPSAAGLLHDLEGHVTRKLSTSDMAFHALRQYQPGDDRRFVHWKASARTGQLMVRQFEETRRSHLTIVLSSDRSFYASDDEYELAVSVAASVGAQVVRSGTGVSVVSDLSQLSTRSVTSLLDDCSRLELGPRVFRTPRDFARETTKRLEPPTVVIFVAGSQMAVTDLRSMRLLFPKDVRSFAFRSDWEAPPSVSHSPDLLVATIGDLDDLRGLVKRLASA